MLQKIAKAIGYDPNKKEVERIAGMVIQINALEPTYEKLSDGALFGKSVEFKQRFQEGESLDDLLVEVYATVREVSKRTLGLRHYDVQMIGGIALHEGRIAEMRTGEGKTLVATLPVCLNAITGRSVHLVTVNDYLARRDARWMAPIYNSLGLTVGVLQMASRTENGKKAFIVDLEKVSSLEDQHQLVLVDRQEAYKADIIHGTNSEFGFDYLRDNLSNRLEERVQRDHYFSIIDEIDNILIDEARTPLIISGPASDDTEWYVRMAQIVRQLNPEDYEISEKDRYVALTEIGEAHVEELLQIPLRDPERPEDIAPEQARILGYLEQALKGQFLFKRNKDYLVQGGKVVIVDEFTGRLMPGRRWSEGLHQSVEAKEGVKVEPENVTYATITIQNYFRMYEKLAGMTGTALTEAEEFHKIYKLEVLPIPTNLEYRAFGKDSSMISVDSKDESGYRFTYYTYRNDPNKKPVFYKRKDFPDVVFRTEEAKLRAIAKEIIQFHILGRPMLVGTTSVDHSDRLSYRLNAESVRRLLQTLLIREAWMKKNKREMIEQNVEELQFLNVPVQDLNVPQMRKYAKSVDLESVSLQDPENMSVLLQILDLPSEYEPRLNEVIQAGIPHRVLNARKHDEEALIISKAGAYGAVTIATNMAGRGVDIKLGGEISEELYADTARVLRRGQYDPYSMKDEEKRQALLKIPEDQYGIYADSVNAFLQSLGDMEKVRALGGLHVIGSERHEARRIDNQLRGRSSRQGDPGSSRFYLSLEDELMRLFGGQQVEGLMKRLNVEANIPIESGIVGRLVEQSQERVEGANFDVRKHLLEYDDVLNKQRQRIYDQRDRVFTKEDLTDDVMDMLKTEVDTRVGPAMEDEEGPWKLVAFLSDIQPPIDYEGAFYPSFLLRILMEEFIQRIGELPVEIEKAKAVLLQFVEDSLTTEQNHTISSAQGFLQRVEEAMDAQKLERLESLDTFIAGLSDRVESEDLKPQALIQELSNLVRTPLRLTPAQIRDLMDGSNEIENDIRDQIEAFLISLNTSRAVGTFALRIDSFDLKPADLSGKPWADVNDLMLDEIEAAFNRRKTQLLGSNGQISAELDAWFKSFSKPTLETENIYRILVGLQQGNRLSFDRKTHRQVKQRYMRLNYVYLAAHFLQRMEVSDVKEMALSHMEDAIDAMEQVWGLYELNRLQQSQAGITQLDALRRSALIEKIGQEKVTLADSLLVSELDTVLKKEIGTVLGGRTRNEIYRELLLSVISQMWVEYLTKVEALRVSIGMEAYAQRDPLVQYKSQASTMFKELLADIRSALVSRMFTYRPSQRVNATIDRERSGEEIVEVQTEAKPAVESQQSKKKRRRH
jgi:preprotein translocase subunit SecA